jgi:LysR family transcriptional regulator of beta-lactamase
MLAQQLREPADLARQTLLRSYRTQEWEGWFAGLDQTARWRAEPCSTLR